MKTGAAAWKGTISQPGVEAGEPGRQLVRRQRRSAERWRRVAKVMKEWKMASWSSRLGS